MVGNDIKIFKLNYDGTFDEIAYDNIKYVFTIVNILAVYIEKEKTMYIWIGLNSIQTLKNHITKIRVLVKDEFPKFTILRNITVEMRSEPYEFFENLGLTKEELNRQIYFQEKTVLPVLAKIEDLKKQSEDFIETEEYKKAIEILKEIIPLTRKIKDEALETEQKRLISELTEKHINKKIVEEFREETKKVEKKFYALINAEDILGAHTIIKKFKQKYETAYDLTLIPESKGIIVRDSEIWKVEKERLMQNLSQLEKDLDSSLKSMNTQKAKEIIERGRIIANSLDDEKILKKLEVLETKILEAKKKSEVMELVENFIEHSAKLKEKSDLNELKLKLNNLINQVKNINLPEYLEKLNVLKTEIEAYEDSYNKTLVEIKDIDETIQNDWKNAALDKILEKYEKILEFVKSMNNLAIFEKTTTILGLTEKEIEDKKIFEEQQENIRSKLIQLEKDLNSALKSMEITIASRIIGEGKELIQDISDKEAKKKWNELEKIFLKTKKKDELIKIAEILMKESSDLEEVSDFNDLKAVLYNLIYQMKEVDLPKYLEKLENLKAKIAEAEKKRDIENEHERIKQKLSLLEEELNSSLKRMDLLKTTDIIEDAKKLLEDLTDNKVKEKWRVLEKRVSDYTQFVGKIEELSKFGIESLMDDSFTKSLEFFNQIITFFEEFLKNHEGG